MSDTGLLRQKNAPAQVKRRLKMAGETLSSPGDDFYAALEKGSYGCVADYCNLPQASLGTADVSNILTERGAANEITESVITILKACQVSRFGPGADDQTERQALLEKTTGIMSDLIRSLRK